MNYMILSEQHVGEFGQMQSAKSTLCDTFTVLSTEEVTTKTPQKKALKRLKPMENIEARDGEYIHSSCIKHFFYVFNVSGFKTFWPQTVLECEE